MNKAGIITNLQRFSIHDGPGVRTVVFLKGCPMRCFWCHNPEAQNPGQELQLLDSLCIGCGECGAVCPRAENGRPAAFTSRCTTCLRCCEACYAGALKPVGTEIDAEDLTKEIAADAGIFSVSGGGVTFSGGEPLMQPDFLCAVLKNCRSLGIRTAVETAACVPFAGLERCRELVDLFYCDIKTMDSEKHLAATGLPNGLILDNLRKLSGLGCNILFRTPVIPGFNDDEESIGAICDFVGSLPGHRRLELLEFHNWCGGKYTALRRKYPAAALKPDLEKLELLRRLAVKKGVSE